MTDKNTDYSSEQLLEDLGAACEGKTPQELADIALGNVDPGFGALTVVTLAGKEETQNHDMRYIRLNAMWRLAEVDRELAGRVAEAIATDTKSHWVVRKEALKHLPEATADSILRTISLDEADDRMIKQQIFRYAKELSEETFVAIATNKGEDSKLRRCVFLNPRVPEAALVQVTLDHKEDFGIRMECLNHPRMSANAAASTIATIVGDIRNDHNVRVAALYSARLPADVAAELALSMGNDPRFGLQARSVALNHPAVSAEQRAAVVAKIASEAKGNPSLERDFAETFGE